MREKVEEDQEEEEEDVRGPEEEVWGDGVRGELAPPEEIDGGREDDDGGDVGGDGKGKRKRGGSGGSGGRKAARGKQKSATATPPSSGGTATNFAYAKYGAELKELGRMKQAEVVAKVRLQAQTQHGALHKSEANEGASGDVGGAELSGAGHAEDGGTGKGEGDGLSLDGAPAPHPNFLRWWRLGTRGRP